MKTINLEEIDAEKVFLHYTAGKNLPSIEREGLLPKIGANSKYIERTEKIFFCVGTDGFLMIMDVCRDGFTDSVVGGHEVDIRQRFFLRYTLRVFRKCILQEDVQEKF